MNNKNMRRGNLVTAFAVLFSGAICCTLRADNWAHWRGPEGNGTSPTAHPPVRWSATENIKWKVEIPGKGSGSPVVWGNKVFVTSSIPTGVVSSQPANSRRGGAEPLQELQFVVYCFDRTNGNKLWEKTAVTATPHQETHSTNTHASASPCTDGERVYASFGSRGVFCYTMDGELVWKRDDFVPMQTRNGFGEGSSPVLEGDLLLLPWDHEGPSSLYALNKLTGETKWNVERDEPTCWATPMVVDHNGQKQVIMNGEKFARSYDLQTGEELWRCAGQTARPCASPVAMDDVVFVGSGFKGAFMAAFRLDGRGDIGGTEHVKWSITRDCPDVPSPLLTNGRIFFYKGKSNVISAVDAKSGKTLIDATRIPELDTIYASPIAAGGNIYLTDRAGTTVVIKDSDQYSPVSVNSVGEPVDATPAPVDGELFIRGERHLFCIADQ